MFLCRRLMFREVLETAVARAHVAARDAASPCPNPRTSATYSTEKPKRKAGAPLAFKLLQIDETFNLFNNVTRAVDLCARPAAGARCLRKLMSDHSRIVAVDLQPMAPIDGVHTVQGDITSQRTVDEVLNLFREGDEERLADLVVCDGAPDVTGLHDIDDYIQGQLLLSALAITANLLRPGGSLSPRFSVGVARLASTHAACNSFARWRQQSRAPRAIRRPRRSSFAAALSCPLDLCAALDWLPCWRTTTRRRCSSASTRSRCPLSRAAISPALTPTQTTTSTSPKARRITSRSGRRSRQQHPRTVRIWRRRAAVAVGGSCWMRRRMR